VDEEIRNGDCGYEPNYRRQIPIDIRWYAENYDRVQNDFLDLMGA
jgi:putative spermidine/putrescine transport system substrate-binding protein